MRCSAKVAKNPLFKSHRDRRRDVGEVSPFIFCPGRVRTFRESPETAPPAGALSHAASSIDVDEAQIAPFANSVV